MKKRNMVVNSVSAAILALGSAVAMGAVTVTGTDGACTSRSGTGHKAAIVFFGDDITAVPLTERKKA